MHSFRKPGYRSLASFLLLVIHYNSIIAKWVFLVKFWGVARIVTFVRCKINNHTGEIMLDWQQMLQKLQEIFPGQYQNDIEYYIISKNPQTPADVEHWMQEWTNKAQRHNLG
jgi:hypothetical protein